jgi:phosphatidylserine/phosphatidylglycerophosphate/cardiolipin synthase-like enzyme
MKFRFPVVAVCGLAVLLSRPDADGAEVAVIFSPRGGCTAAAVNELDKAKKTINVMCYQLTSAPLIDALARAAARGVTVRITLDRTQEGTRSNELKSLPTEGPVLRTDRRERLQHNKVAIIDGTTVISGSFNWTANAENYNAENLLIIVDPIIAAAFTANFNLHFAHSDPFAPSPPKDNRPKLRRTTFPTLSPSPDESELLKWHELPVP